MKQLCAVVVLALLSACGPKPRRGPAFDVFPAARSDVAFKPPVGQKLEEKSYTERTDKTQGVNQKSTVELVTESSWSKEEGAFILSQRVTRVSATQNGKKVDDPLTLLVTKFPTKFQLAADGSFVRFLNPQDARQAVIEAFPDEDQARQVLSFFTPQAIEDQARIEWEQKYGGLFGRAIEAEKPVYVVDGTSVGDVPVLFVIERTLSGTAQTPYGEAAVFTLRCVQRAEDAKNRAGFETLMAERGNPSLESSVKCEGRQVIAREKFVPVAMELRLWAAPVSNGVAVGEVELVRQSTAEELK